MSRRLAIETLRADGWLSRQPPDFVDELLRSAELRNYADGFAVQLVGDEPAGLFGLASGRLLVMSAPEALPEHLVKVAQPGWWFGDAALIGGRPRLASVVARGSVEVLHVPRGAILRLAERDPETWRRIGQITLGHLEEALRIIGAMTMRPPELRLALALARLTGIHEGTRTGPDGPVEIAVSQSELGEMARMTRNATLPALRRLELAGLVDCSYRRITIGSVRQLWQYIESAAEGTERAEGMI